MAVKSRLLTDEEYCKAQKDSEQEWMWGRRGRNRGRIRAEMMFILEAQDTKSVKARDKEIARWLEGKIHDKDMARQLREDGLFYPCIFKEEIEALKEGMS